MAGVTSASEGIPACFTATAVVTVFAEGVSEDEIR